MSRRLLSLLVTGVFVFGGCAAEEEPPELPQVSSISANLEGPASAPLMARNANPALAGDYQNFANAWVRVSVVQVVAVALVAVPAAVIGAALSQEPRKDGELWRWSVTALGATADLQVGLGLVDGWDVELRITNANLTDYLWVEGNFATILTSGTWVVHNPELAAGADSALEISWTATSEEDYSLSYSNVDSSHEGFGDVMSFSVLGTSATLVFEDASEPTQVATIQWDIIGLDGSIQVPLYNEGNVACWDGLFVNATCP
jgi:hypothetical protein